MGFLIDGRWRTDESWPVDSDGRFVRRSAAFRGRLGEGDLPAEPGRYHLYLAHACPWCHRTAITRALEGLEAEVSVSFVEPLMRENGWVFGPETRDPLFGSSFVHEIYTRADPAYSGRATLPILWDKHTGRIVSNESADIVRSFDVAFDVQRGGPRVELYPERLRAEIDEINTLMYDNINNGVYRCGFASTQRAYEEAFSSLFSALDAISARLRGRTWLVGDQLTEADIRLYVTLVRFDAVYVGHFKCNRSRIADDPTLDAYLRRLYALSPFRSTTHIGEIKTHYYGSHRSINPTGIVPVGPQLSFLDER